MTFTTTGRVLGGYTVDRVTFRKLLPDNRWFLYAAGLVNPGDGNNATITIQYVKDNGTTVTIGSDTSSGATVQKRIMGPFDLFATGGMPSPQENVVCLQLFAQKNAGANGVATNWTLFLRQLPAKT